jgi:hypothetical protein
MKISSAVPELFYAVSRSARQDGGPKIFTANAEICRAYIPLRLLSAYKYKDYMLHFCLLLCTGVEPRSSSKEMNTD